MNMVVLRKTRRRPKQGDIFALSLADGLFRYGRLVATDANAGGFERSNLIYIYRATAEQKEAIPPLLREQLLVAPKMTNNLPWVRGYFETLGNDPIGPMDRLRQHSFRDVLRGWFFDEYGRRLQKATEPVGEWVLHSYRTIDDAISEALGVPLAPDDDE